MMGRLFLLLITFLIGFDCTAIEVVDDSGKLIKLNKPAKRVITLAPHLTEMMFAIGKGNVVVATVSYSDFPMQAKQIPRLGGFENAKLESILAFNPDLILAWNSGNNLQQLAVLENFGLTLYRDNPKKVQDVARTLRNIGILTGSSESEQVANDFLRELDNIKDKYRKRAPVRVFYQFWDDPVYTINGEHYITDVLAICGMENVFASMVQLSAPVNREAIIKANPEMIIAAGMNGVDKDWMEKWRKWREIKAVKYNNLFTSNPDWLHRHTPRLLLATEQICKYGDQARKNMHIKKTD